MLDKGLVIWSILLIRWAQSLTLREYEDYKFLVNANGQDEISSKFWRLFGTRLVKRDNNIENLSWNEVIYITNQLTKQNRKDKELYIVIEALSNQLNHHYINNNIYQLKIHIVTMIKDLLDIMLFSNEEYIYRMTLRLLYIMNNQLRELNEQEQAYFHDTLPKNSGNLVKLCTIGYFFSTTRAECWSNVGQLIRTESAYWYRVFLGWC